MSYHPSELTKARALLESSPLARTTLSRDQLEYGEELDGSDSEHSLSDIAWFPKHFTKFLNSQNIKGLLLAERDYLAGKSQHPSENTVNVLIEYGLRLQDIVALVGATVQDEKNIGKQEKEQIELDMVKLLQRACTVYQEANDISRGKSGKILFNWAVVLSDLGRLVKDQREKIEFTVASCLKYSGVVSIQEENIQALNNWGLVICDLAHFCTLQGNISDSEVLVKEKLFELAISCFRRALQCYNCVNDRDVLARCSYNMGSVMYQFGLLAKDNSQRYTSNASKYVSLALALDPSSEFFSKALESICKFLPLPFLLHLKLIHVYDESREQNRMHQWVSRGLVLNTFSLKIVQMNSMEVDMEINIQDITSCYVCEDPWIPFTHGLHICLKAFTSGFYLSTESKEEIHGLKDAICMLQISSGTGLQKLSHFLSLTR